MTFFLAIAVLVGTFVVMECITWCTHKFVMHGFLWVLHSDHHKKDHDHFLERNDAFFLVFGIPSFLLCLAGVQGESINYMLFIGLGVAMYGLAYVMVHDIFIHQRIPILKHTKIPYFLALRKAHKVHHKHLNKEDGECFGMLFVPYKYFREAYQFRKRVEDS